MNSGEPKSMLFVLRRSPLDGCRPREDLDQVFSAAAFDQTVHVLLLDDGVWQLHPDQQGIVGGEPLAPLFAALALYDVDIPWVEEESLRARGLHVDGLVVPVRTLKREQMSVWLASHDVVIAC